MLASSGNRINIRPQGLSLIRKYIYYMAVNKIHHWRLSLAFSYVCVFLRLATVPLQRLLYCKSDVVRREHLWSRKIATNWPVQIRLTNRFHVASRRFSNRSQITSTVVRTKKWHTRHSWVRHWSSYHFWWPTATWNLFIFYHTKAKC